MVKTQFGIKDLENLSNVKAHTIRIWEKRYNLLEPDRTNTNIRKYDIESLKKLLNIAYLYNAGYKISKLASLNSAQIQELIKTNIQDLSSEYTSNIFKSAMFEFDGDLFDATVEKLLEQKSLREIFKDVFVPLLNKMGILWHSGTIDPSHEHFISEKIKHTIIQHSEKVRKNTSEKKSQLFALFLPYHEIHEIGLLYANYEILSNGYNSIYLGANIPLDSLNHVLKTKRKVIFVTYFTVHPEKDNLDQYIENFQNNVSSKGNCELWILGPNSGDLSPNANGIYLLKDLIRFTEHLKSVPSS